MSDTMDELPLRRASTDETGRMAAYCAGPNNSLSFLLSQLRRKERAKLRKFPALKHVDKVKIFPAQCDRCKVYMCRWCGTRYCKECGRGDFTGTMSSPDTCRVCFQTKCQGQLVEFGPRINTSGKEKKSEKSSKNKSTSPKKKSAKKKKVRVRSKQKYKKK